MALLRGVFFLCFSKIFLHTKIQCEIGFARYKDVEISCAKGSRLILSKNVRIASHSVVSATNGGKIEIGEGTGIGQNNTIKSQNEIKIGRDTIMGPNVLIYDHDHKYSSKEGVLKRQFTTAPISIGNNCWIGANTVILKGTTIGDNTVIGAGSVIKGNIPPNAVVVQKRQTEIRGV